MKSNHFKISIIIPCLNEEDNLSKLIPYLLRNGHDKLEIIVVDGNSSDNSLEIAKKLGATTYQISNPQRARQMNLGARNANQEILLFLHADVLPPKTFLRDILESIHSGNKGGWFSYEFDKSSGLLKINEWFTKRKGIFAGGGDQCLFILKSTFEKLGKFNEDLEVMEDFQFTSKLKKNKIRYKLIKNNCKVSSRKYETNSWVRVNFANLTAFTLYHVGVNSFKIKSLYSRILNS